MTEISHKPCPNCDSTDAFSYNVEKKMGYCHSCTEKYPKPGVTYPQEVTDRYPVVSDFYKEPYNEEKPAGDAHYGFVGSRGITAPTMEHYGVKTLLNGSGEPLRQEYVYPSGGKKIRTLPKSFSAFKLKSDELFGMNLFPSGVAKHVTITEGELDALSVWQMVQKRGFPTPVVSLPSAAPSKALWENVKGWLDGFDKIILSIDHDEAGDRVAEKINNMFPNKVYRVDHGQYKDANDFLRNGKQQEFKNLWFNAKKWVPDNILHSAEDLLKLYTDTPQHTYVPTGIQALDDKAMGLMQGHFTLFKAPTGIGKTELMRYLEWNFIERGVTFASWHLEETKLRSLLGLVSYDLNDNVTRKDLVEEKGKEDEVRASIERIASGGNYYQYYLKEESGADELLAHIRLMATAYDCKYVMVEPIQDVINIGAEDSKESALASLAVSLSRLAADLNIGIISIAHTNDDGEIKYCRMLGQRASVIIRLDRDKEAEDFTDRNTTRLILEKNRPCSEEGPAGEMLFDPQTFTMEEI
jgi:twinkle protein